LKGSLCVQISDSEIFNQITCVALVYYRIPTFPNLECPASFPTPALSDLLRATSWLCSPGHGIALGPEVAAATSAIFRVTHERQEEGVTRRLGEGGYGRVGSVRDGKGRIEWKEWQVQIFKICISRSKDERRCLLLPEYPLVTWR
jgi:hypothetical protein